MWKRTVGISLIGILLAGAAFYLRTEYLYRTFVDRSFLEYTGISNHQTEQLYRDNGSWAVRMRVNSADGKKLALHYHFQEGFHRSVLEGLWAPNFVSDCPNCSYMYRRLSPLYRYRLIVLSKDKTQVTISETFSDM